MGPDSTTLMRFDADRAAMDQILSARCLDEDREILEQHPPATDWAGFWGRVFGTEAKLGGKGWQSVKPMTAPKVYRRRTGEETATLLWDAASGHAYVIYGTL
jgi:hypothetical protein